MKNVCVFIMIALISISGCTTMDVSIDTPTQKSTNVEVSEDSRLSLDELRLAYSIVIHYSYGELSLVEEKLISGGYPNRITGPGSHRFEVVSFDADLLYDFNYTFEMQEKLSPPQNWFDDEGNQIVIPNEEHEEVRDLEDTVIVKYFPNAALVNVYQITPEKLRLSVDVSKYHDLDGDAKVALVDNCPREFNPDQSDADLDGVGDLCE